MLEPTGTSTETMIVEIPDGSTIKDVGEILYDQGLIKNTMIFQSYAGRHSRGTSGMQAGNYEMNHAMSIPDIVDKMLNGDVYSGAIPVLLSEGKNINEMAQILEKHNICTSAAFISETKKLGEYKALYPILSSIPDDKNRTLEGYLFPDTYEIEPGSTASDVVKKMLDRFTEVYNQDFMQQTIEKGKTVDEIVIMASIVELETKPPEDKANAASVFITVSPKICLYSPTLPWTTRWAKTRGADRGTDQNRFSLQYLSEFRITCWPDLLTGEKLHRRSHQPGPDQVSVLCSRYGFRQALFQ